MTLGNAAAAHARLIVWCTVCHHQTEPDPADRYGRSPGPLEAQGLGVSAAAAVRPSRPRSDPGGISLSRSSTNCSRQCVFRGQMVVQRKASGDLGLPRPAPLSWTWMEHSEKYKGAGRKFIDQGRRCHGARHRDGRGQRRPAPAGEEALAQVEG